MNYKTIMYALLIVSAIIKLIIIYKNKDNYRREMPYRKYTNIFLSVLILVILLLIVFFI
ncbi:hypothetical protein HMPREF3188_00937 [Tissierellia bacterium KA00581]|nr:hypothetical protein HMPREF3188_00937 [Tissierellia bacterium KA00581]